jgi:Holliday junction resolvase RusA-like endonuclease
VPSYPGKRNGDNDDVEKGTWDAITSCGAVWCDDSQIVANSFRKRYAAHGETARTIITIRRPDT